MQTWLRSIICIAFISFGGCTDVQKPTVQKAPEGTPVRVLSFVGESIFIGSGSFVLVSEMPFFVTAYHVVDGGDRFVLQTYAEDVIPVELIRFYSNKDADVTVFRVNSIPEGIVPYAPKFHTLSGKASLYGFPSGRLVTVDTEIAANALLMHEDCQLGMSGGPACYDGFQIGFVHASQSDGKSVVIMLQKEWFISQRLNPDH